MTLYHGTCADKIDSILQYGLEPQISKKLSNDPRLNKSAVYGFDTVQAAIDFMVYDNCEQNWVVFSFEANDIVSDPEYDSEAFAVVTDDNIKAQLVCKNENYE